MVRFWTAVTVPGLAVAAGPVMAQETRGNISGTVQDAQGVVPERRSRSPTLTPTPRRCW